MSMVSKLCPLALVGALLLSIGCSSGSSTPAPDSRLKSANPEERKAGIDAAEKKYGGDK
jgi:hypothetical protein